MIPEVLPDAGSNLWNNALAALKDRIRPQNFSMWLQPIRCTEVVGSRITLRVPNRFIKDWFEANYLGIVSDELRRQTQTSYELLLEVEPEAELPKTVIGAASTEAIEPALPASSTAAPFEINARYSFDSFVVGPSNQLAHAAARAVAELPAAKYNPLFIYGGVGLGKTHLLCAIGQAIHERRPDYRIIYLSSERFMNEFINYVRANRMEDFRGKYREQCDVLLMDDIQFIAGRGRTQEEFFHTFNALYDVHRQIVVTSDKYPHEIPELEERLRTRFQWGLIADIQQPEFETRVAILKKKAASERIALPDDVALFLAEHIRSNVRELEGSLIRLAAFASLQGAEVNIAFAQESLKSFLSQAAAPSLTIEAIQKEVSAYFNIKLSDLKGPKRHKALARPRQIAMYLSRKLTSASFPEIGQRFGGKDHSTVISACRKIQDLVDKDVGLRNTVETLERQLQL